MKVTIRETVVDTDGRGFYARPVADGTAISASNIHIVSLEPGAVRGNHCHERQTEYICVLGGRVRFVAVDDGAGETIDTVVEGANAPVITIPPRGSRMR